MSLAETTCKNVAGFQIFGGSPQMISVGNTIASVSNSTTETNIISETVPASVLNSTDMQFRVRVSGTISSDGTDDVVLTLRYGSTDILALTTVSLPNEDDKAFSLQFDGRVLTANGSSSKVVAFGKFETDATGIADLYGATAAAGVTVDLSAEGALNISAEWDGASADTDILTFYGSIEFFN